MSVAEVDRLLPGQRDHPRRRELNDEVHARPAQPLLPGTRVTHIVMHSGEGAAATDRAHLARLCEQASIPPPARGAVHHVADLGNVRIRWERHSECSTYTLLRASAAPRPFVDLAIEEVPADWLNHLPGERLAAIHLSFVEASAGDAPPRDFTTGQVNGSRIADGKAVAWTDFRIRADGYSRMIVESHGIGPWEAGHQIRRLLELETYRMLMLLAMPLIREISPRLSDVEQRLSTVTGGMRQRGESQEAAEQRDLASLTELAAEIEDIAAQANYRIAASRAYHGLIERRLELLREDRVPDCEPLGDYLERRLRPAADTFTATRRRIDDVAERVNRTNALLRTRLEVKQATRSRDLLESMDRRAGLQLRLEQAVEAITVIAGAYYGAGLLRLLGKGLDAVLPVSGRLPIDVFVGLSTPVIIIALWLMVRRIRAGHDRASSA